MSSGAKRKKPEGFFQNELLKNVENFCFWVNADKGFDRLAVLKIDECRNTCHAVFSG